MDSDLQLVVHVDPPTKKVVTICCQRFRTDAYQQPSLVLKTVWRVMACAHFDAAVFECCRMEILSISATP